MTIPVYDAPRYFARRYFNGIWPSGVSDVVDIPISPVTGINARLIQAEGISVGIEPPPFAIQVQLSQQLETRAISRPYISGISTKLISPEVFTFATSEAEDPDISAKFITPQAFTFAETDTEAPDISAELLNENYVQVQLSGEVHSVETLSFTTRLDELLDVDPVGEIDGATVIYDANTDTYFVKRANLDQIEGFLPPGTLTRLDGGSF
jgi:hypothetical protein